MHPKKLVKLSNLVGMAAIILLIYWVFIFVATQVFGFRVFRENITETFYLSILGILALMAGALIINIMFNLTRIAQKHDNDETPTSGPHTKTMTWLFIGSFPVIFALLFVGDQLTSLKKERVLTESAQSIIADNAQKIDKLLNYSFDKNWILQTNETLSLLSKLDKDFPNVYVLIRDTVRNTNVFLRFHKYSSYSKNEKPPKKLDHIANTTKPEREYLNKVFDNGDLQPRFSAHDGKYELFYPHSDGNRIIVLYFSDYRRYGKIGS